MLHTLNEQDGRTIVMVTHNEGQAKRTIRFFDRTTNTITKTISRNSCQCFLNL